MVPLVARPNAGGPQQVGGRFLYPATPAYFADNARLLLAEGVSVVGGCCGTGPAHVRAMAAALEEPRGPVVQVGPSPARQAAPDLAPTGTELSTKLAEGRFVVAVEMDPPRGFSTAGMLAGAETLAETGADVIDVADSPMARMRMSPWAACRLIQEHVGIETVLHFPTRGRNLLRLQGDLLAVHALGIRDLFVCLGDPMEVGDYPGGTDTIDVAPTGLISLITDSFNRGRDHSGASIGEPTSFVVGCALNPAAPDLERECRVLRRKIDAGAAFALSQPVYSFLPLARLRKAYESRHGPLGLPILAGLLPLSSSRHAEFLHNEVPGVSIPEEVRDRLRAAGGQSEGIGLEMAHEVALELRQEAAGVYLMPQFGRFDVAAEIVETLRRA
jgi:homocysteine S-methyltransferase